MPASIIINIRWYILYSERDENGFSIRSSIEPRRGFLHITQLKLVHCREIVGSFQKPDI